MHRLWLRGGFPASYLASDEAVSLQWRQAAMQRHVSGDLALLGINVPSPMMMRFWQMLAHPLSGASWEGFALEQVLRIAQPDQAYFWATHQGAELDLLMFKDQQRIGVAFKRSDAPSLTTSMRIALNDLQLKKLYVVYPGNQLYALAPSVEVVPLKALLP